MGRDLVAAVSLPLTCFNGGVYFWIRSGRVMYVGKTCNFAARISSHHVIPATFLPEDEIRVIYEPDDKMRTALESDMIAKYRPPYNHETKDDRRLDLQTAYVTRTGDTRARSHFTIRESMNDEPAPTPTPDPALSGYGYDIIPEPYPTITISELGLLLSVRDSDIRKMMETGKIRADAAMVTRYGGIPVSALPEYMRSLAMVLT